MTSSYLTHLAEFAAGITPVEEFYRWNSSVLVGNSPTIIRDVNGELSADFPFTLEWATYLDMVSDRDDPNFDELEARRLAGALSAILTQIEDDELRSIAAHFARSARTTAETIRGYVSGVRTRAAFERAISRRPWPEEYRAAVKRLSQQQLIRLVEGLENNDYAGVITAFD